MGDTPPTGQNGQGKTNKNKKGNGGQQPQQPQQQTNATNKPTVTPTTDPTTPTTDPTTPAPKETKKPEPPTIPNIIREGLLNGNIFLQKVAINKPAVIALKGVSELLTNSIIPAVDALIPTSHNIVQSFVSKGNVYSTPFNINGIINGVNVSNNGNVVPIATTIPPPLNINTSPLTNANEVEEPDENVADADEDVADEDVADGDEPEVVEEENRDEAEEEEEAEAEAEAEADGDEDEENGEVKGGALKGEGTFGCVHDPALKCKDDATTTTSPISNHISKVMKHADALKEIALYDAMRVMDPKNQYYLGVPTICEMDDTDTNNKTEIAQCKKTDGTTLLRMKNGGVDLWEYGQKENVTPQFWAEFHRCIKGVERFLNGGYVHYDIKPDNIVYDETENRVNFIDFGLMRKKRDIFEKGVVDGIRVTYHTTYSLEHFFYNKTNYERVLLGSHEDKKRFITNFRNLIVNDGGSDPLLQSIHKSIVGLFRWIGGKKEWWDRILKDYEEFIMLEREPGHFREFVASALNKFDIYGLGLTVVYMLRCCRDTVTPAFSDEMYELAYQMITPNIYSRVNVVTLSVKYTEIVRRHYGTSIANIGAVLNSHTPFNAGKKMGGGGGGGKTPLNVIMDGKNTQFFEKLTVKRRAQIPQHVTMKKNPHFVIANLQTHINVSKKRRNKYRFMKNKKRRNPPTLKGM